MCSRPKSATSCLMLFITLMLFAGCEETVYEPIVVDGVQVIPGDLTLQGQSEVDLMLGLQEVRGNLRIIKGSADDPVTDLRPLASLVKVEGFFWVSGHGSLRSLTGLENLAYVGRIISLMDMPNLVSLSDLGSIEGIREVNLSGLNVLQGIGNWLPSEPLYKLSISQCDSLSSLSGLEHLSEISSLEIASCNNLHNLDAISQLTKFVRGAFSGNEVLTRFPSMVGIPANLATNSGTNLATRFGFIWPPIPAQFGHPI